MDPYAILGVEPGASPQEIMAAFRERAQRCHPDLFSDAVPHVRRDAEKQMAELNAALAVVLDRRLEEARRRRRPRRAASGRVRRSITAVAPAATDSAWTARR